MTIGYKASKQSAAKRLSTQLSTWTAVDQGGGTVSTSSYTRPSDWLAMPDLGTTQQFVGLYAIFTDQNLLTVRASGNYTVDWGDGIIENYTSNVAAYHSYSYAAISSNTLSSRGYKQVFVKITPQAGYNITALNFQRMYTGQAIQGMPYNWLEMAAYTPYLTDLLVGAVTHDANMYYDQNNGMPLLEIVDFKSTAITDATNTFCNCKSLQLVKSFAGNLVYTPYMFANTGIKSIPLLSLGSCTDARSMFANSKLESIPNFTLTNVQQATSMFSGTNITSVSNLTLTNCYSANSMFANCYQLRTVGSVTVSGGIYVPAQSGQVRYCDNMFQNTPSLTTIGTVNISTGAQATYQVSMVNMFDNSGIIKLPDISRIDTSGLLVYSWDLGGMYNLSDTTVLTLGIGASISFRNAKLSSASLNAIYSQLNTSASSRTINVTNCFGSAGSNKTLATNRNWTVVG